MEANILKHVLHILAFHRFGDDSKIAYNKLEFWLKSEPHMVNARDARGRTPLDEAISISIMRNENWETDMCYKLLREHGAKESCELNKF
jgi:hypothetical protein